MSLTEEESRAIREGLDEESLAIFDLLSKTNLSKTEIDKIKKVAEGLLNVLKEEKLRVDHWRDKESTRDAVKLAIHDYLWQDETGLPIESYSESDINLISEDVFRHIYRAYPKLPSPYYEAHA